MHALDACACTHADLASGSGRTRCVAPRSTIAPYSSTQRTKFSLSDTFVVKYSADFMRLCMSSTPPSLPSLLSFPYLSVSPSRAPSFSLSFSFPISPVSIPSPSVSPVTQDSLSPYVFSFAPLFPLLYFPSIQTTPLRLKLAYTHTYTHTYT